MAKAKKAPKTETTSATAPTAPARWRATWKGQLRFGLVSFTVEAVNVRSPQNEDIRFHQLHAECHQRIKYQKVCPLHGEVSKDEIVSGYEYAKGKYVEIEPEELDKLRSDKEKALTIDNFLAPEEIDPTYFDGRMYYLIPPAGESLEPYQVIAEALEQKGRWGIGHIVMSGKDQVVAVGPKEGVLVMALLNYAAEIRPVQQLQLPPAGQATARNRQLAEDLIESWSDPNFDFAKYEDGYRERVSELISAKVSGDEVVVPASEPTAPPVINLMDALKRSLAQAPAKKKPARSAVRRGKRRQAS